LRNKIWEALRYLKSQDDLPWSCVRDFNEVLSQHEHQGINPRNQSQMSTFRDYLDDCRLTDLGFKGYALGITSAKDQKMFSVYWIGGR
jgi:hypothetical protein